MSATYSEILRHPFWQKKKNGILDRDKYTCQKCGDTLSNLQVHHKYYKPNTMPWEYPDDALVTYCELCHRKAEFIKWLYTKGQASLLRLGLEFEDRHEVLGIIARRSQDNHNKESAELYMGDIKRQLLND